MSRTKCTSRSKTPAQALSRPTLTGFSSPCSRPNRVAWEWAFRFATQSSRTMRVAFGFPLGKMEARSSNVFNRRRHPTGISRYGVEPPRQRSDYDSSHQCGCSTGPQKVSPKFGDGALILVRQFPGGETAVGDFEQGAACPPNSPPIRPKTHRVGFTISPRQRQSCARSMRLHGATVALTF